jgi:methyltransferase (TIGR00027 family)
MALEAPSMTMVAVSYARAKSSSLLLDQLSSKIVQHLPESNLQEIFDQNSNGMFTRSISVRSRYYENILESLGDENQQLIVLSAGLDTRALQIEEWNGKAIFNVDHPLSHELCKEIFDKAKINHDRYRYVPYDLTEDTDVLLVKLVEKGFKVSLPTLVIWEGSTFYLETQVVYKLIEFLSKSLKDFNIFFDFANWYHYVQDVDHASNSILKNHGEPWIGFFKPEELKQQLLEFGLQTVRIIDRTMIEEQLLGEALLRPETIYFAEAGTKDPIKRIEVVT